MADKKLLLKQNAEDGFFADDDPLAALALIANFDPQGEVRPRPTNLRREPEFNLEDELLKEFEQYQEPVASEPAEQPAVMEPAQSDVAPAFDEQVYAEAAFAEPAVEAAPQIEASPVSEPPPAIEPAPIREYHELRAVPEPEFQAPAATVRPVSHPVFDLEDEILREFAAFDAKRASPAPAVAPQPVQAVAPVAKAQENAFVRVESDFADLQEIREAAADGAHFGYGDDDVTTGTEVLPQAASPDAPSLDAAALDAMEAELDPVLWQETKASILRDEQAFAATDLRQEDLLREDTIHFAAEPADEERWDDEVSIEAPAAIESVDYTQETVAEAVVAPSAAPVIAQNFAAQNFAAETVAAAITAQPAILEPELKAVEIVPPVAAPVAAASRADDFGLDALLADVERYPVAAAPARWPDPVAPRDSTPRAEAPIARPLSQIAAAVAKPVAAPKAEPVAEAVSSPAVHDAFDDGAFELDLSEIELDMLEMEVESLIAPAVNQDHIDASPAALAEVARTKVEEKPVYSSERAFVPGARVVEDYSTLPFDPTQVSSEEDPVETLAEMDVPEAPVADHGIPAPTQPDYDIDIDAEMAHIFSRPSEPAQRPASVPPKSSQQAAQATPLTSADLDEFERALEEDFRRSLSENRATSTPDRVALTPAAYDDGRRQNSTGRRLTILAASVAGLVLIGGAGVYAYWGNPGEILSTSSEPKIILADKNPVKVQPADRGGQTVPNQDKAVYERVSGDDKNTAKQERLVTTNEEPVDVVQKTLMPETLPMDDEEQASNTTDTSDTADPRLLPADGQDKNITTTEKVVSGVSPRKVRTMVVRSDGTLVPRDDSTDQTADQTNDQSSDQTPAEASQDRPLEVTPAAAENVPERLAANDAVAKEIEQASTDKAFVPNAKQPSDTADADADDNQVVTQDLPAAKTEEQPVAVADDNAKPAAADTKPVDQTAIDDAASADVEDTAPIHTVKTTQIVANTPIPESRPVDQPVDIVGKVTNDRTAKKTQEVANADPVQPADNSQAVQTTSTPAGSYVIQIASLPSEAEAQSSYTKLSAKFSSVIGGRSVDIRKAAIKNKGTYYRVRIPAGSRQEATDLCSRYKAAGGSCLVSK